MTLPLWGLKVYYAEDFLALYHQHLKFSPERHQKNLSYLRQALSRPLTYSIIRSPADLTPLHLDKYRLLFQLQIYLLQLREYTSWAAYYDRPKIRFYDGSFQKIILKRFDKAQRLYGHGLLVWDQVEKLLQESEGLDLDFVQIPSWDYWDDKRRLILDGSLSYKNIIEEKLQALEERRGTLLTLNTVAESE